MIKRLDETKGDRQEQTLRAVINMRLDVLKDTGKLNEHEVKKIMDIVIEGEWVTFEKAAQIYDEICYPDSERKQNLQQAVRIMERVQDLLPESDGAEVVDFDIYTEEKQEEIIGNTEKYLDAIIEQAQKAKALLNK